LLWRIKEKVAKKKIRPRRAGVFPDGITFGGLLRKRSNNTGIDEPYSSDMKAIVENLKAWFHFPY